MAGAVGGQSMQDFLQSLTVDIPKLLALARRLCTTFKTLAAESENQFLPTPISDTVLRPSGGEAGRYLAIDIGGTNLRVGFVELLGGGNTLETASSHQHSENSELPKSHVHQTQKSWPIGEKLKQEKAEDLFAWIGECIATVIEDAPKPVLASQMDELPMGVTFSFPMIQQTLADATLMSMGKGFAITSDLDLGKQLLAGYAKAASHRNLPKLKIVAIVNDAVATLVSFVYQLKADPRRKAAMGLIVGTGINATIPMKRSSLKSSKRPRLNDLTTNDTHLEEQKIVVNTEWTIKGAAGPLRELDLITRWDKILDAECDAPGFQPFEYMTAGRYLGELGRLMILEYFTKELRIAEHRLPARLRQRNGLTTTYLGQLHPNSNPPLVHQLSQELPPNDDTLAWHWTDQAGKDVYHIAKAIQVRAAGMAAAAIIGLLACADDLQLNQDTTVNGNQDAASHASDMIEELIVGYTGGCIVHFQDYLHDCQQFLDQIMHAEFGARAHPRVVLQSSHDGGIIGAGVLAGTVQNLSQLS